VLPRVTAFCFHILSLPCGEQKSQNPPHMKPTTVASNNPMNRSSCPLVLLVIPLVLACVALSPQARATCQQGCLPNSNTVLGDEALVTNTTGAYNTAIGFEALSSNTLGFSNTATGSGALQFNTTGYDNTADGYGALLVNTSGSGNTAIGGSALELNTAGGGNTAVGTVALSSNTTGSVNTAIGTGALKFNTDGGYNTASGASALAFNNGSDNTANRFAALYSNNGDSNTATGFHALLGNRDGDNNTASGAQALASNRAGNGNTASGVNVLSANINGDKNTAVGIDALLSNTTGSFNIALGAEAGGNLTTGSNNVDIANRGVAGESNTIRIGARQNQTNTFIAGISGATVAGGVGVIIDTEGHLGTVVSSARFKEGIKPMEEASEAILELKPVTFRYKHELDPEGIPEFGLVAEDVEKVNPDLVARDDQGKPFTVRYEAVNAMLLNEFLKEHRKVEKLEATVAQQHKDFETAIAELKGQIQKVSARLEVTKTAPQTVLNNR